MAGKGNVIVKIDGDASGLESKLKNIGNTTKAGMADVKAGIDLAVAAMQKLAEVAGKGIAYNASIEQLQTSFEVMTGSAEKAAEVVDRLRTMGAETPFEMIDLAGTTQLLMQYGFTADEAINRMSMLGDIAQGNKDAMTSIAMGYAQMSSAGKVNLQDIKQMINGGFNPLQEISERTGESMESLYDRISKGTLSVDEITQSMVHATSEGGKYFQSMEKQSQTLNGQLSTLRDNVDQLLGDLTAGMSDELRDGILPMANGVISSLQEAFQRNGTQGLVDAATDMIPSLMEMLTSGFEQGFDGFSKWLPKGAQALMKAVPGALRSSAKIAPKIVGVMFELTSTVVADLVTMLPELAPVVLDGFQNLFLSAAEGAFSGMDRVFKSIFELMGIDFQAGIDSIMDTADAARIKDIQLSIDGEIDTSGIDGAENQLTTRINTLYENVRSVLTDGAPDTEEVIEPLKAEVDEVAKQLYADIDSWEQEEIAKLDPEAPDFAAACESIKTEAAAARTDVELMHTEIVNYIDSMAGKSTATVEATISQMQSMTDELVKVAEKYSQAAEELSPEANAFKAVRAGAARDEKTVGLAIDYVIATYKVDQQSVLDTYNATIDQINADFASGVITSEEKAIELKEDARIKLETDKAANESAFRTASEEIMTGLAHSLTAEERKALDEYYSRSTLLDDISNTVAGLAQGDIKPVEIPDDVIYAMYSEFPGAPELTEMLYESLSENVATFDMYALLGILYNRVTEQAADAAANADTSLFASAWSALLSSGGEDANAILGDVDLDTLVLDGLRTKLGEADFSAEGAMGVEGYAEGWTSTDPFDMPAVVDTAKKDLQKAQQSNSPAKAFVPLGKDAAAGYGQGMTEYDFSGDVSTMVSTLQSTTSTKLSSGGRTAGGYFASGLASGIRSGRSRVVSAAVEVVKAAIRAANAEAKIQSPSRVMMDSGRYFSEGFAIGIEASMGKAVAAAKRMTNQAIGAADMANVMRVANMPNLQQEIINANEQSRTPVYLDGVQIAEIQGYNNSTQLQWRNDRAAKGVGSR